jgi:hypothetical protein
LSADDDCWRVGNRDFPDWRHFFLRGGNRKEKQVKMSKSKQKGVESRWRGNGWTEEEKGKNEQKVAESSSINHGKGAESIKIGNKVEKSNFW